MKLFKKYRVLVINPIHASKVTIDTLEKNTPLPVIFDPTIPNAFRVRRIDRE